MSGQAKQKLSKIRPVTISQASRVVEFHRDVSGVVIYMGR
jgi:tRNA U34 5-carboxymethylaminomethyl modifying enzyme MnmG/GidA